MIKTVALISPLDNFLAFGLRLLSSHLKSHGIRTKLILLPTYTEIWQVLFNLDIKESYKYHVCKQILDVVSDCDAIGITMMTPDKPRVKNLLEIVKPLNKPVLLGGIHPTAFPEDAIEMVDYVCVGEGLDPLVEWCKEPERLDIENMWVRTKDNVIHKNPVRPAIPNIDILGFPDYSIDDHWILYKNNLCPMTEDLHQLFIGRLYQQFASLGCPFSCTYCINNHFKKLGVGYNRHRIHSVDYIIREIKYGINLSTNIEYINFPDDGFIAQKEDSIKEFSERYKREINLPFSIMGVIPSFLTERKLDLLVSAGLKRTRAGFQSGNQDVLRSYRRPEKISTYIKCNEMLQRKKELVFPYYDIITDNPLLDTEKDALETINFLLGLKGRFTLLTYSLLMYPGTEIYNEARELNIDDRYFEGSILKLSNNILNYIITWIQCTSMKFIPRLLLKIYNKKGNIKVPNILFRVNAIIFTIRCGMEHLIKGDVVGLPEIAIKLFHKSRRKYYPGD